MMDNNSVLLEHKVVVSDFVDMTLVYKTARILLPSLSLAPYFINNLSIVSATEGSD